MATMTSVTNTSVLNLCVCFFKTEVTILYGSAFLPLKKIYLATRRNLQLNKKKKIVTQKFGLASQKLNYIFGLFISELQPTQDCGLAH